ncbi:MAG: Gx transporter family protein, partial [Panacagrimonas sp.]
MRSPTEMRAAREDRLIAAFAALAIAIHVLEATFPSPVPGVKPGLANVVTLIVLLRYSFGMA